MRLALTGNPNSGKTTMYNALTGQSEKVGNWAGVTVSEKESEIRDIYQLTNEKLIIVDLPGAYSISPYSSEESITRDYVSKKNPDVIINIVDATNLSRSLFFTTQLLELNIPMVIALNKSDLNVKKGNTVDAKLLSKELNCPVVETSSINGEGLKELVEKAINTKEVVNRKTIESDEERFAYVKEIVKKVEKRKTLSNVRNSFDKLDEKLTDPLMGLIIFALIMFGVFYISQAEGPLGLGKLLEGILVGFIEGIQEYLSVALADLNPFLYAVFVDGIIGGVGAVLGFLPLVMVMYFLIALLEDCGYMARATVVLDPIFKKVGLSGKSVIPMIIGTGCSIPAIMSTRTIKSERERKATAMLTSFMPCGAKLPLIALFAGAFFPDSPFVGPLMYFTGIALILLGALLIRWMNGVNTKNSYFIIELPEYKLPSLKFAFKSMLERGKAYIVKAGTIILVCNTVVQIMQSFSWNLSLVEEGMEHTSILAGIAGPFAVILLPIVGFASWQLAAASITGFIAKENVVGTIASVYALSNFIDTEELVLLEGGSTVATVMGLTKAAALAYLMFNLFTPPCFAAIGALNSELNNKKELLGAIGLQCAAGFTVGFLVYQIGTLIATSKLDASFLPGLIVIILIVIIIVSIGMKNRKEVY
ncbi:MAG: ferrous iron transporter B [Erysipelotrichaceae bacterium]|nr:ferrous iron transporter B [Erysipelotrichaceae bacterium]